MSTDDTQGHSNTKIIDVYSKLKDVAKSLGKYDLKYLLQFSSFLSIMSFLNFKDKMGALKLWKFFNPVFGKKFSKAILLSESKTSKSGCFQISDLKNIYYRLAKIDPFISPSKDERGSFYDLMASGANTQIYYQEADFHRQIGRSLLLYDIIPEKYDLKNEKWIDIFGLFRDRYNLPMLNVYYHVLIDVVYSYSWFTGICKELEKLSENDLLQAALDTFHLLLKQGEHFTISIHGKTIPEPYFHSLSKYYDSISVPIKMVTKLGGGVTTKLMISDWHLFRVHPFVRVAENQYIVPSIWELVEHLKVFHMPIIDSLDKERRNQWFTNLGLSYEKYVYDYMVKKHPNDTIIPESTFGNGDLGPDITILDTDAKTGIFIEIKTVSIPLAARSDPSQWNRRLTELVELVEKLYKKAQRIFSGEGDYTHYRDIIDLCQIENSILVIICGNLGYFFEPKLLDMFNFKNTDFPTNNILFLDIIGAENLIEYSYQNDMTLFQAFNRLLDIQSGAIKGTNIKDAFSQYDRELAPWYQTCMESMSNSE
ncbi:MAG: hypothetical protein ACOYIS_01750 [Candidatus Cloacimonadaceae bacterium]|jgi:hypothetical protein